MKKQFFLFNSMSPAPPRQQPKSLLSIFHAGVLGLQAQGSLHEKLKYLYTPNLVGARPHWGRAHGMGAGGSPRQTGRKSGFSRPARLAGATDRAQFGWGRGGTRKQVQHLCPRFAGAKGVDERYA